MKVLCVVGTRPEVIKMAPVIKELQCYPDQFEVVVCTTAQHRQMLDQMLALFNIVPDIDLDLMQPRQSLYELTSRMIVAITKALVQESPDCVLIQGDTTTVMIVALACFYEKIPVGHVEAGLRTKNRYSPFPEEMNRRLTSHLSTYHFAPTDTAVKALKREGIPDQSIWCTGNTVIDAINMVLAKPSDQGLVINLKPESRLILVTAHRRENFGKPLDEIMLALRQIVKSNKDVEIVYPVHPNPNVKEPAFRYLKGVPRIHLIEPLDYLNFVSLMRHAYLILTDSGGIQEEASALGKPVLVIRSETERTEAAEAGITKIVGTNRDKIIDEAERLLHNESEYNSMARVVSLYGDGNASKRIVDILLKHPPEKMV